MLLLSSSFRSEKVSRLLIITKRSSISSANATAKFRWIKRTPSLQNRYIHKSSHQQLQRRSSNTTKYAIISLTAFFAINAFGTYTHFHDNLFQYYPLPFAIDAGVGPSMLPTLTPNNGELYLRDVWSHRSSFFGNTKREYQRGDVVTMYNPYTQSIVTKRIVGVEGDTIQLFGEYASEFCEMDGDTDGGVPVDERFNPPFCQTMKQDDLDEASTINTENRRHISDATMKVPPNHVWVEGDNPLESTDSRHYGPLPISALRGRIVMRLWPMMSSGGFYRMTQERPSPFSK